MITIRTALKIGAVFLSLTSGSLFAQSQSSVGVFSVGITLNGVAQAGLTSVLPPPAAGACVTQTLFNQFGAVVRVTCVDNPFVSIAPSIDMQFPGTFGNTFRYPLRSNSGSFKFVTVDTDSPNSALGSLNSAYFLSLTSANTMQLGLSLQGTSGSNVAGLNFNSPTNTGTVTDMSIYRTAPQATVDTEGLMDMVISF